MGEKIREALRVQFDKRLRLEFQGARITSDDMCLPFDDPAIALKDRKPLRKRTTKRRPPLM
jgi:hypothetical protein